MDNFYSMTSLHVLKLQWAGSHLLISAIRALHRWTGGREVVVVGRGGGQNRPSLPTKDLYDKYTNFTFPQNLNMINQFFFTSYHATKKMTL